MPIIGHHPAGRARLLRKRTAMPVRVVWSRDTIKEEYKMSAKKHFTIQQALEIGGKLGIEWTRIPVEQFRMGLDVELEHGLHDPTTDVTGNDPILTGKIALAHLNEFADYYTRLEKMEREAEAEHRRR